MPCPGKDDPIHAFQLVYLAILRPIFGPVHRCNCCTHSPDIRSSQCKHVCICLHRGMCEKPSTALAAVYSGALWRTASLQLYALGIERESKLYFASGVFKVLFLVYLKHLPNVLTSRRRIIVRDREEAVEPQGGTFFHTLSMQSLERFWCC